MDGSKRVLGGVIDELVVEGEDLGNFSWLLNLGALMNIGKGAAYGAGCYQVENN